MSCPYGYVILTSLNSLAVNPMSLSSICKTQHIMHRSCVTVCGLTCREVTVCHKLESSLPFCMINRHDMHNNILGCVCMYVYMYVYMYVCTYECLYVCIACMHCMYVCMYICMYVCMYVRTSVCRHAKVERLKWWSCE